MKLGVETNSQDADGEVVAEKSTAGLTEEAVRAAFERFRGEFDQVPPMYSAVKINGVPCYKLARKGKEVERKARHVAVLDYEITRIDLAAAEVDFRVHCTKGFYVRTYAHDIGQYLGCGAHLTALRIKEAKRLIREGKHSFSQIAENVGFESIHYFSTVFKKHTGMTPSDYARSLRAK
jgi:tRNA pseudouridine55 synthase